LVDSRTVAPQLMNSESSQRNNREWLFGVDRWNGRVTAFDCAAR
jgi:hypothetical protein